MKYQVQLDKSAQIQKQHLRDLEYSMDQNALEFERWKKDWIAGNTK